MTISVLIATKDRPLHLERLLASLCRQTLVPDEIVVVDNNSVKDYSTVLAEYSDQLPIKYVREDQPGIAHARNRAVAESIGEYLVFIDDDCVAHDEWIANIVAPFEKNPHIGIVGGGVLPKSGSLNLSEQFCKLGCTI